MSTASFSRRSASSRNVLGSRSNSDPDPLLWCSKNTSATCAPAHLAGPCHESENLVSLRYISSVTQSALPEHWSALVPELSVRDLDASLSFYRDLLGFSVRFSRPEEGFAYLELGRAQIMLEQLPDDMRPAWLTGELRAPFGRGLNLQIEVDDVATIHERLLAANVDLFRPLRRSWYREETVENGQDEFLVQDPDGYLLRFMQHIGTRPVDS